MSSLGAARAGGARGRASARARARASEASESMPRGRRGARRTRARANGAARALTLAVIGALALARAVDALPQCSVSSASMAAVTARADDGAKATTLEIAGRGAMREVAERAGIKLLEPVMKVEVVTPEDYLGDVIGDINSRRGQIQGTDSRGNAQAVDAFVPLANMFGYINTLRSMSSGRANFTMQFDHYAEVPKAEAQKIVQDLAG